MKRQPKPAPHFCICITGHVLRFAGCPYGWEIIGIIPNFFAKHFGENQKTPSIRRRQHSKTEARLTHTSNTTPKKNNGRATAIQHRQTGLPGSRTPQKIVSNHYAGHCRIIYRLKLCPQHLSGNIFHCIQMQGAENQCLLGVHGTVLTPKDPPQVGPAQQFFFHQRQGPPANSIGGLRGCSKHLRSWSLWYPCLEHGPFPVRGEIVPQRRIRGRRDAGRGAMVAPARGLRWGLDPLGG